METRNSFLLISVKFPDKSGLGAGDPSEGGFIYFYFLFYVATDHLEVQTFQEFQSFLVAVHIISSKLQDHII